MIVVEMDISIVGKTWKDTIDINGIPVDIARVQAVYTALGHIITGWRFSNFRNTQMFADFVRLSLTYQI